MFASRLVSHLQQLPLPDLLTYHTLGSRVASDVLAGEDGKLSYPESAALVIVGRIAIAVVVTMCYPL